MARHRGHTAFALAGASHSRLLFALEDLGIAIVGSRHETGTVAMADGYARTRGAVGFALIITEQGVPNAISAIATAHAAASPVVVLATRYPDVWLEPAATDEGAHELTVPITKWRRTVPSPERLAEFLHMAVKVATEGRPGPVLLTIPQSFLDTPGRLDERALAPPAEPAVPSARAIAALADAIASAERPLIVADSGAARAGASAALRDLSNHCQLPVLGNNFGRGQIPEDGRLGFGWPYAQPAAAAADLVLVLGARMDMWYAFGRPPRINAAARVIHLAADASDIGRTTAVDAALLGDPRAAIEALTAELRSRGYVGDPTWLQSPLADRREAIDAFLANDAAPLHPMHIGDALQRLRPHDRLTVCDGADSANFMHATLRVADPNSYLDPMPFGSMGIGLPLAIGAAAAERELCTQPGRARRRTVLVTGDGALGFYIAELDSARRAGSDLTVVVSNDGRWGTEYHGQQLAFGRTSNTDLGRTDYAAVAVGFGCAGEVVRTRADLEPALRRALDAPGPALVDVNVHAESGRLRKVDPRFGMIVFSDLGPTDGSTS